MPRLTLTFRRLLAVATAGAFSAPALGQTIAVVPPAPGFQFSSASYIAPGGTVVGISSNPGLYTPYATRWASVSAPAELLDPAPGGGSGEPARCSDDGAVVVGRWSPDANTNIPARWGADGSYTALPSPGSVGVAVGVSADGSIVTGWSATSQGRWHLRWENGALAQQFGPSFLSGPCSPDGNTAIGVTYTGGSSAVLSRWSHSGGPNGSTQTLAPFPSAWTNILSPAAMTPSADAAVGLAYTGGTTYESWIWRDGQLTDMGLPSGAHSVNTLGITADAALVVASVLVQIQPNVFTSRAQVWSPQSGWQEFDDWLAAQNISFAGWEFRTLRCVSPDGLTFAGQGVTPSGEIRGFVVTIPGPGAGLALLLGWSLAATRRAVRGPGHGHCRTTLQDS